MNHNITQDFIKYIDDDDLDLTLDIIMGHVYESYSPGSKKRFKRQQKKSQKDNDKNYETKNLDGEKNQNDKEKNNETENIEREKRKKGNTSVTSPDNSDIQNPNKQMKTTDSKDGSAATDDISMTDVDNFELSVADILETGTPVKK